MIKVDLITGFLGSGKTTFIRRYARYLMEQGQHIGILENDYGAVNVDMMLLQDLEGEQCELEMVAGGCDAHCHRRRFKTKLISMGMCGYDRVLVEPSGIFDVDEFFDVLCEEPLNNWYEIGNVLAIVDAGLETFLSGTSDYLLASETAHAGKLIFSKIQMVSDDRLQETLHHLNRALQQVKCSRQFDPAKDMLIKNWDAFGEEDWQQILTCGYRTESYEKKHLEDEEGFSTVYYLNLSLSEETLLEKIPLMMQDPACGYIFRVKGFMRTEENQWIELNATRAGIQIQPIEKGQEVLILIGENLQKDAIQSYIGEGSPVS